MAIKFAVDKHTVCNPGNLLASKYGEHMVSLNITQDTDNGRIVKVGEMETLDAYKVEEASTIDAYIFDKNADGTWLVVVNKAEERTALIYQKPLIDYESPRALTQISNFYNVLHSLDRFSLSDEGFSGTPKKGGKITTITDGKLVVAE